MMPLTPEQIAEALAGVAKSGLRVGRVLFEASGSRMVVEIDAAGPAARPAVLGHPGDEFDTVEFGPK